MRYAGLDADRAINGHANYTGAIAGEIELTTLAARADNTLVDAFWFALEPTIPAVLNSGTRSESLAEFEISARRFLQFIPTKNPVISRDSLVFISPDFASGHLPELGISLRPLEHCSSSP
jgi:hypothetical protein